MTPPRLAPDVGELTAWIAAARRDAGALETMWLGLYAGQNGLPEEACPFDAAEAEQSAVWRRFRQYAIDAEQERKDQQASGTAAARAAGALGLFDFD